MKYDNNVCQFRVPVNYVPVLNYDLSHAVHITHKGPSVMLQPIFFLFLQHVIATRHAYDSSLLSSVAIRRNLIIVLITTAADDNLIFQRK